MPRRPRARRLAAAIALVLLAASLGGCLQMAVRPTPEPLPTPTPSPSPPPTPTPTPGPATPTPEPTFALVKVKLGDNLGTIAKRFSTTPRSIAFWNRDTYPTLDPDSPAYAPNLLKVGWVLKVKPGIVFEPTPTPEPADSTLEGTPAPSEYLGPPTEGPSGDPSPTIPPEAGPSDGGTPDPSADPGASIGE